MYEIYINDRPLRLIAQSELAGYLAAPPQAYTAEPEGEVLVARYSGKIKTLLHYADTLEKASPKVSGVLLYHNNLDQLWSDFKSHYKIIAAAGGVVQLRDTERYLFIYRRGYLDLPKGKIDLGESTEQAALREVREETGLAELSITNDRPDQAQIITFHTYRNRKEKRVLKPTYWYRMQTGQNNLIAQTEEDIEWARWLTLKEVYASDLPLYNNLRALLAHLFL